MPPRSFSPFSPRSLARASQAVRTGSKPSSSQRLVQTREHRLTASSKAAGVISAQCRSEDHTSELQPLMRITYAVFGWKQKKKTNESASSYEEPSGFQLLLDNKISKHLRTV